VPNPYSVKGFRSILTFRTGRATMGIRTGMSYTLPPPRKLPALCAVLLALAGGPPARAQEPAPADPAGFRRQYLQAEAYRTGTSATLSEWPELGGLIRASRELEAAVAEDDQTLSGELLLTFRARVDSLAARPLPAFMEPQADVVRTTLDSLGEHLARAEAWLGALPPAPAATDGSAVNEVESERTLVTGRTAVTVPAGVRVGSEDSLPTAELPGEEENFLDLLNRALSDLDLLVHLTRTAGRDPASEPASAEAVSSARPAPGPSSPARTAPPRRGP
jgi:hypothetical protein